MTLPYTVTFMLEKKQVVVMSEVEEFQVGCTIRFGAFRSRSGWIRQLKILVESGSSQKPTFSCLLFSTWSQVKVYHYDKTSNNNRVQFQRYSAVQKSSDTRLRDKKRTDLVAFLKRNLKFFLPWRGGPPSPHLTPQAALPPIPPVQKSPDT